MARIRTVKPEFWTDGDVMDLSPQARLLFIGSWNFALCDYGHLADDARRLRRQVLPEDDVMMVRVDGEWAILPMDPVFLVDEILTSGRMVRLTVDERSYLHIVRFTDHQRLEKRWTPRCPACKGLGKPLDSTENLSEPRETSREFVRPRGTSASDRTGQDRTEKAAAAAPVAAPRGNRDLPPAVAILRAALEAHKLTVQWSNLSADDLADIERLVSVHGDTALVKSALRSFQPNRPPATARAWLAQWRDLRAPGDLAAVKSCPERGHSGTTTHCAQCASEQKAGNR